MTLEELGAALREAREKAGMEEKDIAAHLRIPVALVSAIEAGNPGLFPHQVYAKGCIKSYAGMMRISDEDVGLALSKFSDGSGQQFIVRPLVGSKAAGLPGSGGPALPDPRMISGIACGVVLLLSVALVVSYRSEIMSELASWWPTERSSTMQGSTVINILPDAATGAISIDAEADRHAEGQQAPAKPVAEAEPKGVETSSDQPAMPAQEAVPEVPVVQVPESPAVPVATPPAAVGVLAEPAQAGDAVPKAAAPEQAAQRKAVVVDESGQKEKAEQDPTANGPKHVIEVKCIEPSWLSFRPDKGKRRNLDMMPGDRFVYEFTGSVTVRLGNAGGVFIILDGVPQRHLGRSGDVKSVKFPR